MRSASWSAALLRLVADLARTQEAAKRSLALHTVGDKVGVDGKAVMAAGRVLELEKEVQRLHSLYAEACHKH